MSSLAIRLGSHLLDTSCGKQSTVALSSGEAEYYAITRGSAAAIVVQNILAEMNRRYGLACLTDSSAAKGISHRRGVGKVKQLELRELWGQDKVDKGELEVRKIGTDKNWSDIGTKALDGYRITQLVQMMPLKRGLVLASLFMAAKAQDPEELRNTDCSFLLYLLILHVLAVIDLVHVWKRAGRVVRSIGCQIQPETKDQSTEHEEPKRRKAPVVSAGIPGTTEQNEFPAGRSAGTAGSGVAQSSSSCTVVPVATQASVEQPTAESQRARPTSSCARSSVDHRQW
eukprot:s2139_g3.t1